MYKIDCTCSRWPVEEATARFDKYLSLVMAVVTHVDKESKTCTTYPITYSSNAWLPKVERVISKIQRPKDLVRVSCLSQCSPKKLKSPTWLNVTLLPLIQMNFYFPQLRGVRGRISNAPLIARVSKTWNAWTSKTCQSNLMSIFENCRN
jgi:hypothetical protein